MSRHERIALPRGLRALLVANFWHTFAFIGLVTFVGDQVFGITGRELDLGLIGLALFVPVFFLSPIGGPVVDRYDKRVVYGIGIAVQIAIALAILLYVRSEPTRVWPFFALISLYGAARSFAAPASRTMPIDLATPASLDRVIALKAFVAQTAIIAGPVTAGFAAVVSDELPYLVSAVALAAAAISLLFVPKSKIDRLDTPAGVFQAFSDAIEGMRYIRSNRVVSAAILLDLFAVLLGGATALLPAIAEERLGVGEVGLGWLRAADGIGAAAMTLTLSAFVLKRRVGRLLLTGVGVFGVATVVLGLTTNFVVAFGAIVVLSAADAISVYIRSSIVPLATPENMRG
ncbi:MAG: MFS transporter, partial [Acidimicrobiales bacterium]